MMRNRTLTLGICLVLTCSALTDLLLGASATPERQPAPNATNPGPSESRVEEPQWQSGSVQAEDEAYRLRLTGQAPAFGTSQDVHYVFEILEKKSGQTKPLEIEVALLPPKYSLFRLHVLPSHRVVVEHCWKGLEHSIRSTRSWGIVDLKIGSVVDWFWCTAPVPSPSKRFCIYRKFIPPHAPPGAQTAVVLVYDMDKAPEENRLPSDRTWPEGEVDVGMPIYPEPYAEARAYELEEQWDPDADFFYSTCSPFLWAEDESCVVFLCAPSGKSTDLVCVCFPEGIQRPVVAKTPIIAMDHAKPATIRTIQHFEKKRGRPFPVWAEELAWVDKEHVVIRNTRNTHLAPELWEVHEIILPVPKPEEAYKPKFDKKVQPSRE